MNYVMGDFGFLDNILNAGKDWISNPKNQQQIINQGIKLIAPPPKPKPKPATQIASSPTAIMSPAAAAAAKDNTMLYVGLGVAGVALIAVVAGLVMARKK